MKAAVLGAGYMGSAITFPLTHRGIAVNLWGTWLDDDMLSSCRRGKHPRLQKPLPAGVRLLPSSELQEAVDGVQAVFIAVSSIGFIPVFSKLLGCGGIKEAEIYVLTKGIVEYQGKPERISRAAAAMFEKKFGQQPLWVSVGGPVKAMELAHGIPTLSIYGQNSKAVPDISRFRTPYYRIRSTYDGVGVELCSAFKNVYALLLGICDGLYGQQDRLYHNFSALLFSQAAAELKEILSCSGADPETVYTAAGIGDLYVTAQSGRNRRYGELVGRGMQPHKAYQKMMRDQEIAEGYPGLKLGLRYVKKLCIERRLPLLGSLYTIIVEAGNPEKILTRFASGL